MVVINLALHGHGRQINLQTFCKQHLPFKQLVSVLSSWSASGKLSILFIGIAKHFSSNNCHSWSKAKECTLERSPSQVNGLDGWRDLDGTRSWGRQHHARPPVQIVTERKSDLHPTHTIPLSKIPKMTSKGLASYKYIYIHITIL